jgi:hypothetical protein
VLCRRWRLSSTGCRGQWGRCVGLPANSCDKSSPANQPHWLCMLGYISFTYHCKPMLGNSAQFVPPRILPFFGLLLWPVFQEPTASSCYLKHHKLTAHRSCGTWKPSLDGGAQLLLHSSHQSSWLELHSLLTCFMECSRSAPGLSLASISLLL